MTLTLSVLRCPDAVPPETRRIEGGEFRIGRGPDNDWVLPDPDRLLSKKHCVVAFRNGGWALADTSTNGTFLNREAEPVGPGRVRELADGDRIRFGAYEIEARIEAERFAAPAGGGKRGGSPFDDPFGDDVFAERPAARNDFAAGAFGGDALFGGPAVPPSVSLPAHYDPLAPDLGDDEFLGQPAVPDHTPSFSDAFQPPPAMTPPIILDDDWDLGFPSAPPPRAAALEASPFLEAGEAAPPSPAAAAAVPVTATAPAPRDGADGLARVFLEGAGMPPDRAPADEAAMLRAVGAALRATVTGIRQALIARSSIKGEFRIEQTMIRARGNNPLKFSADDDDALSALLGLGRRTDVTPGAAIADALRDMRLHELATMAAMQEAVRAMIARLDPGKLRAEAEQAGGMSVLPAQRKARAFEAYERLYDQVARALSDDFDSVFGKAFARAYETALRELSAEERE